METDVVQEDLPVQPDGSINVVDLSLNEFRSKLIRHFNIAFSKNEIKWPKNTRSN